MQGKHDKVQNGIVKTNRDSHKQVLLTHQNYLLPMLLVFLTSLDWKLQTLVCRNCQWKQVSTKWRKANVEDDRSISFNFFLKYSTVHCKSCEIKKSSFNAFLDVMKILDFVLYLLLCLFNQFCVIFQPSLDLKIKCCTVNKIYILQIKRLENWINFQNSRVSNNFTKFL